MSAFPIGCRVAQAIGFTGAAWLAGNISALSTITIPAMIDGHKDDQISTTNATSLWKGLYQRGKSQNPPIAAATASAFLYLAWSVRSGAPLSRVARPNASILYGLAALLAVGIVPYTLTAMSSTNNALLAKAGSKSTDDTDTKSLLQKWASLNAGRSVLPLAAGLVGIFAALF
ncbi:hypothetical protein PISL3812_03381 [Talaromyces islandicus]|uniref:Noranthrone monooxygenase n=1 Tax=Talaromyces islandicus TaxID=28573 RepID=A0A0U1LSZ5_TALIS|nr:hypothetical protein PISL3812_03381 [Talaromyces islandicus]